MLGVGLALTFATSWAAYQNVVWNLLVGAPDQIATLLIGSRGSATQLFAARLDLMFGVVAEAAAAAKAAATVGPPGSVVPDTPADLLNLSALMLLLGTVGVLIVARLALAALLALGPVFIILALFKGTRGLFEGWLKTAVLFAVVPLIAVLVGGGALAMLTPVVAELAAAGGQVPLRLAVTVFLGASVHLALSVLAFKAAAHLTTGWRLPFGSESSPAELPDAAPAATNSNIALPPATATSADAITTSARARTLAAEIARPAAAAAPDPAASSRERVVIPFPGAAAPAAPAAAPGQPRDARAQGLAQRFRTPRQARP
jgi:type IV secretion system protein VirB6